MLRSTRLFIAPLLAVALALPASAFACGGFFCFTQPVDQSAERILYMRHDDKITVHIQISYTGDDDKFSWVLPLLSVPELGIGSDSVFQILEQQTAPRFQLQWQNKNDCYGYTPCDYDNAVPSAGGGGTKGGGGVEVLKKEKVGPYDTVVIKGNSGAELVKWLNDNGYVQPKETTPLVDTYAKEKYVFLALKLQKTSSAGDLAPMVVTLDEDSPCLPIRLTKLAAQPDMPIVAWVLGQHRAIPKNFLHVVLNEATIDWLAPGTNYKTVVSKAVDQGSGHAFTTEYAKKASEFKGQFFNPKWDAKPFEKITDPGKFLQALLQQGWPRTTQMQQLIKKHIPKPKAYEAVGDQEFYNCIQNSGGGKDCPNWLAAVAKQGFDAVAFAKDLAELIAIPLEAVQKHFKSLSYLTRLYTTVDPSEMTKDPIFAFNPDLADVDNLHTAKALPICKAGSKQAHEVKITFADGHELTVPMPKDTGDCPNFGGTADFGKGTKPLVKGGGQPAKKVQVIDEKGQPLDIHPTEADNVDAQLNSAKVGQPSLTDEFIAGLSKEVWDPTKSEYVPPKKDEDAGGGHIPPADGGGAADTGSTTGGGPPGGNAAIGSSSSCSAVPVGQAGAALLLLLATLGLLWRRRSAAL